MTRRVNRKSGKREIRRQCWRVQATRAWEPVVNEADGTIYRLLHVTHAFVPWFERTP